MKKEVVIKLLYAVSILLAVGFCVRLGADWYSFHGPLPTSAPFWLFAAVRAVEFLFPALIVLMVARVLKRREKR